MKKDNSILIIEDNIQNLKLVSNALREEGYKIAVATDGESGIKIAENYNIDLILTDVMMSGMSGYDVCKVLKSREKTKDIPVIFLTGKTDTEDILEGFKIGGADYIAKPFQKEILYARVNSHIQLKNANDKIKKALEKSDELLLNVLPEKVAEDLKNKGFSIPLEFENVSVFVSDFVNFTEISENLDPIDLINQLNAMYSVFDEIMKKYTCERIKTIGDAYLAVCGMPTENPEHALNIINAAEEIRNYIQYKNPENNIKWQIRIGIHTGNVVGGIVGKEKYIYDIFGDTVNTAFRTEAASLPMQINVTETTYNLINNCCIFRKREPQFIKGKGKMNMYFLDQVIRKSSKFYPIQKNC